ncbi:MAG: ATP-binding cassette domain-containing protein [Planctomycetota bacterium]
MSANVVVRNLSHTFGKGGAKRQVLSDVSLEIQPGEIVILTGPSGSGKSTLLTLIGALRSAQDGELVVLGESLERAKTAKLNAVRRRIGFIFQHHNLLDSLTIEQNVQMGLELLGKRQAAEKRHLVAETLEAVGLGDHLKKYPEHLSGGQKQRAAIARSLVASPEIILADEPTASLDKKSGREVVNLLQSLARERGSSVVLVTHDNRILDVADRTFHLEDGRIVPLGQAVVSRTQEMVSLFSRSTRHEHLADRIQQLPEAEFMANLESITGEARSFLQGMEIAGREGCEAVLEQALTACSRRIETLLGAERVTLFLVDHDRDELWSLVARDDDHAPLEIRIPRASGIAGRVATAGAPFNVPDAYAEPLFNRTVDRRTGFRTRTILAMPLFGKDRRVLGVAQLLNRTDGQPFDDEDVRRFGQLMPSLQVLLESWTKLRPAAPALALTAPTEVW